MMEGTTTDVANNVSEFANMILTCIFYSPIIPLAIPAALLGTFLRYWSLKYTLLKRDKMPEMFSGFMASFFANLLPYVFIIQACSNLGFDFLLY